jgi:hypothetical protein
MLANRRLDVTYPLLVAYQSNIQIREHLIVKSLRDWRSTDREIAEGTVVAQTLVRRMHAEQLEILLHVCMLIEDFAYIAWALKHHSRSLHHALYFDGAKRRSTLEELSAPGVRTLQSWFRFPKYTHLALSTRDEATVRKVRTAVLAGLRRDLDTVWAFQRNGYFDVYNEYKHTFDVITGMREESAGVVSTHIYVRVAKRTGGRGRKQITWILDGSRGAIDYYERVFSAASNLINVLIANTRDYCIYYDGRYLTKVPSDYGVSDELMRAYREVIERNALGWSKGHSLSLSLTLQGAALRRVAGRLAEDHIAVLHRPLLSRGKGRRSELTLS